MASKKRKQKAAPSKAQVFQSWKTMFNLDAFAQAIQEDLNGRSDGSAKKPK
jgi:hypothetical protein